MVSEQLCLGGWYLTLLLSHRRITQPSSADAGASQGQVSPFSGETRVESRGGGRRQEKPSYFDTELTPVERAKEDTGKKPRGKKPVERGKKLRQQQS